MQKVAPRMHQNSPFCTQKLTFFSGNSPLPYPTSFGAEGLDPRAYGINALEVLRDALYKSTSTTNYYYSARPLHLYDASAQGRLPRVLWGPSDAPATNRSYVEIQDSRYV